MGILTSLIKLSQEQEDRRRDSEINMWSTLAQNPDVRPELRNRAIDEILKLGPKKAGGLKDIGELFKGIIGKKVGGGPQAGIREALASTGRPETSLNIPGGSQVPPQTTTMGGGSGGPAIGGVSPRLFGGVSGGPGQRPAQPAEAPPQISTTRPGTNLSEIIPGRQEKIGPVAPSALLSPQEQLNLKLDETRQTEQVRADVQETLQHHLDERRLEFQQKSDERDFAELNRRIGQFKAGGYGDREATEHAYASMGKPVPRETGVTGLVLGTDPQLQEWGRTHGVQIDPDSQYHVTRDSSGITGALRGPAARAGAEFTGQMRELADAHKVVDEFDAAKRTGRKSKYTQSEYSAAKETITKLNRPTNTMIQMGEQKSEAEAVAEGIVQGKQPPTLSGFGMRGVAAKVREILQRKYPDFNLARAELDWRGMEQYVRSLNSAGQLRLRQATEFSTESLSLIDNRDNPGDDLIGQLRRFIPRTQFPILNKAALAAARQGAFGDAAASAARQFDIQITDLQSELAVVYRGGNAPTDVSLNRATQVLAGDWSENTLRDAVDLARKNLQVRLNSIRNVGPGGNGGGLYAPPPTAPATVSSTPVNRAAPTVTPPPPTKIPKTADEFNAAH